MTPQQPARDQARAQRLQIALKVLKRERLSSLVWVIRDRVRDSRPEWEEEDVLEHPRVRAFLAACRVIDGDHDRADSDGTRPWTLCGPLGRQ